MFGFYLYSVFVVFVCCQPLHCVWSSISSNKVVALYPEIPEKYFKNHNSSFTSNLTLLTFKEETEFYRFSWNKSSMQNCNGRVSSIRFCFWLPESALTKNLSRHYVFTLKVSFFYTSVYALHLSEICSKNGTRRICCTFVEVFSWVHFQLWNVIGVNFSHSVTYRNPGYSSNITSSNNDSNIMTESVPLIQFVIGKER